MTAKKGMIEGAAEMWESKAKIDWRNADPLSARYAEGHADGLRSALRMISGEDEEAPSP